LLRTHQSSFRAITHIKVIQSSFRTITCKPLLAKQTRVRSWVAELCGVWGCRIRAEQSRTVTCHIKDLFIGEVFNVDAIKDLFITK
jgi:hypothetical protein